MKREVDDQRLTGSSEIGSTQMAEGSDNSTSSKDSTSSVGMGMKATIKLVRTKFSKVKDITTETLDDWLSGRRTADRNVVLMDCRDECEYQVSHLEGAQRVDWEKGDPQQLLERCPADKPCTVVCYCSVGYRSSSVADRMQKFLQSSGKGQTAEAGGAVQVFNLEGSLFKWANEGRPMVSPAGQPTPFCHPYSSMWGRLLHKDLRRSDGS